MLTRRGYLIEEQGMTYLAEAEPGGTLTVLAASYAYRIALGPRAGQKVLSLQPVCSREKKFTQALCANAHGFSLHAGVRCGVDQRQHLERLCCYVTRPALAHGRIRCKRAGQAVLQPKSAYQDGTTHLVLSPIPKLAPAECFFSHAERERTAPKRSDPLIFSNDQTND